MTKQIARSRRSRLPVAERREQLLAAGLSEFDQRGYDDAELSDIAAAAGVSRSLVYHYFPDKAAFFVAVLERQLAALGDATRLGPVDEATGSGDRAGALRGALDAYFAFVGAHPNWYRSIYRSGISADSGARELVERAHAHQATSILACFPELEPTPLRRLAVRAWVSYLATVGMGWLDGGAGPHEPLREHCLAVLATSLGDPPVAAT